jgi:hypothetical protein
MPYGVTSFRTPITEQNISHVLTFLYALRRDLVWNPTVPGGVVASGDAARCAGDPSKDRNECLFGGQYGCLRW